MSNLEKAKTLLKEKGYTCVLCSGEKIYTSNLRGVAPMVGYLNSSMTFKGFSAADKVVGKAAAMLFVLGGVYEVYADVMTEEAKKVLTKFGIKAYFQTLTEHIMNRSKTGFCPMEQAVARTNDPQEAFEAIKQRLEELKNSK